MVQTDENVDLRKQIKILAECEIKGISRKIDMLFQTPFTQDQAIFKTAMKEGILL